MNRSLVFHVAPWDWDVVEWAMPSWFPVVQEGGTVAFVYSNDGQAWSKFAVAVPLPKDMKERMERLATIARSAGMKHVFFLPHQIDDQEHIIRQSAATLFRNDIIIAPDCDEYLLNPEVLNEEIISRGGVPEWCISLGWQHVTIGEDGKVREVLAEQLPTAVTVHHGPRYWFQRRMTGGAHLISQATLWHFRTRRTAEHEGIRKAHVLGFDEWFRTAKDGEAIPPGFGEDAAVAHQVGGRVKIHESVPEHLIPPTFRDMLR